MTVFMAISRLLSVAMGLGIVLGTRRLALALHGDRAAALFAALICAASPTLVFFCHTGNVDAPHVFWFTAVARGRSLGLAPRHAARPRGLRRCSPAAPSRRRTPSSAPTCCPGWRSSACMGCGSRESAARTARSCSVRRFSTAASWCSSRASVGVYALVQNALFNPSGLVEHFRIWTEGGPVLNYFRAHPVGPLRFLQRLLLSLETLLGAPMLALCAAGAAVSAFAARRSLALWLPFLSYTGFSLLPAFVEPRVVLPLLPLLAVWGASSRAVWRGFAACPASSEPRSSRSSPATRCCSPLNLDLHMIRDSRYAAEALARRERAPRRARRDAQRLGLPAAPRAHGLRGARLPAGRGEARRPRGRGAATGRCSAPSAIPSRTRPI